MCLRIVSKIKKCRGYKYFPRADLEVDSVFQSGDFSWNTNIVLRMGHNNEYIVISVEEPGKYILSGYGNLIKLEYMLLFMQIQIFFPCQLLHII